jgi:hypothetical protein
MEIGMRHPVARSKASEWTDAELAILRNLRRRGLISLCNREEVEAALPGRTFGAARKRADKFGAKIRPSSPAPRSPRTATLDGPGISAAVRRPEAPRPPRVDQVRWALSNRGNADAELIIRMARDSVGSRHAR